MAGEGEYQHKGGRIRNKDVNEMSLRRCPARYCPELVEAGTFCDRHKRIREKKRGTPTQRGYGRGHQKLRADYQKRMNEGEIFLCARCAKPVKPNEPWDLGHNDARNGYNGVEHSHCNRKAGGINGGIASHRKG